MPQPEELTELQQDALRELGCIGAAHAATALSQLIGKRVDISVPTTGLMRLTQVRQLLGGNEQVVACIHSRLLGDADGTILVLLPREAALKLADTLLGHEPGTTCTLSDMAKSALLELANILSGAYLTAISDLLGILLLASVPALNFDIVAGALVALSEEHPEDGPTRAFVVHTEFHEAESAISGHFLLAPDKPTMSAMLTAIHRLLPNGHADTK